MPPPNSIQIKLDIDAIAGKISTDQLSKDVQTQIIKTLNELKKSKGKVNVGLDLEKVSNDVLQTAIKQFERDIDKVIKTLSRKRDIRLGIADALKEELLKANKTIEKDGKIVGAELEKVLKAVAGKFKLGANISSRRSPLREFLLLEGDSVKSATRELNAQAAQYQAAVEKTLKQRTTARAQDGALTKNLEDVKRKGKEAAAATKEIGEAADNSATLFDKLTNSAGRMVSNVKRSREEVIKLGADFRKAFGTSLYVPTEPFEKLKTILGGVSKSLKDVKDTAKRTSEEVIKAGADFRKAFGTKLFDDIKNSAKQDPFDKFKSFMGGATKSLNTFRETTAKTRDEVLKAGADFRKAFGTKLYTPPAQESSKTFNDQLKKQVQEVLKLRDAYKKAAQEAKLAQEIGGTSDYHLRKISREREALEKLQLSYKQLQVLKQANGRDTAGGNRLLGAMTRDLKDLSGQLRGFDNLWSNAARSMQLFFRYAIGYKILYEITGAISKLVTGVKDFQNTLIAIKAVTDATSTEIAGVGASILSVAQDTKFSVAEVAEGAKTLAQAGIPLEKLGTTLKATANLASTTGGTISEAADLISTFTLVYKDFDPSILADKLANAANISKLSLADLSTVVSRLIETTEGYTIAIDSMLGATETLRNVGIKPSTIATGTRQAILELFSPDDKLLNALQARYRALGQELSTDTIRAMFQGFQNAKDPLLAAINELQKLGFAGSAGGAFDRVFDVRAENVIRALVENKDAYVQNVENTKKIGSAAKGAATQLESLTNTITNLGSSLVSLGSDIGLSAVNELAGAFAKVTEQVKAAREAVNELKQKTGETGASQAAQAGAGAGALAFGRGLGGFKSLGLGIVVSAATEWATLLTRGNEALTKLVKVTNDVIQAMLLLALANKAQTLLGLGKKSLSSGDKLTSGLTSAGKAAAAGAAGAALGGAGAATLAAEGTAVAVGAAATVKGLFSSAILKPLISVFSKVRALFSANPVGLLVTAGILIYEVFDDIFNTTKAIEKDYDAIQQATAKRQQDATDALTKLNEKNAGAEETKKTTAEFINSVNSLKEITARYAQLGKQSIDAINDGAELSLEQAAAELKNVGFNADISKRFGETTPQVKALIDKAIKGTKDIGTQAFQDVVDQLEKLRGLEKGAIDKNRLATDLQAASDAIQKAEAARAAYVRDLELALDKPDDAANKATIDAYQKLPGDVQAFLQTSISSVDDAIRLADLTGKGSLNLKTQIESTASAADQVFQTQIENAKGIADAYLSSKTEAEKSTNKNKLLSLLQAAVKDGGENLTEALVEIIKVATGQDLSPSVAAAAENAKQKLLNAIDEKVQQIESEIPAEKAAPGSLLDFSKNADTRLKEQAQQQVAREQEYSRLQEERLSLAKTIKSQLEDQAAAIASGVVSEEDIAAKGQQIAITEQALSTVKSKLAKMVGVNVDAETKIADLKRGFTINEEDILAKEKRLATLLGAKVSDTDKQVNLSKEIFQEKSKQLELEKAILEEDLRKKVEASGAGSTKGLTGQQILDSLNNELGSKLLSDNKELAAAVKAYTEVLHEASDLEEKHLTQLQNIYQKDLDKKKAELDQQKNKTQTIESELQNTTNKLSDARSKLADLYDKQADAEAFYNSALRAGKDGKGGATKSDLSAAVNAANANPNQTSARAIVDIAKELLQSGVLSESQYRGSVEEARAIEAQALADEISQQTEEVNVLEETQALQTQALQESIAQEQVLTQSIDSLTSVIEGLPQQLAGLGKDTIEAVPVAVNTQPAAATPEAPPQQFAGGGEVVYGPDGIDQVDAKLTKREYVLPTQATNFYGSDLLNKLRKLQIPKESLARAPALAANQTINNHTLVESGGGSNSYQPVHFTVGDATIATQADPGAVAKFKAALGAQALKTGKRIK